MLASQIKEVGFVGMEEEYGIPDQFKRTFTEADSIRPSSASLSTDMSLDNS